VAGNHESEFGIGKDVWCKVLKNPIASVLRPTINPSSIFNQVFPFRKSVPFRSNNSVNKPVESRKICSVQTKREREPVKSQVVKPGRKIVVLSTNFLPLLYPDCLFFLNSTKLL
jgi:hypothetical protein